MSEISRSRPRRRVMWIAVWTVFVVGGLLAARFHLNDTFGQWAQGVLSHYPKG